MGDIFAKAIQVSLVKFCWVVRGGSLPNGRYLFWPKNQYRKWCTARFNKATASITKSSAGWDGLLEVIEVPSTGQLDPSGVQGASEGANDNAPNGDPALDPDAGDATPTPLDGKFSKVVATLQLLYAVPLVDAGGTVVQLDLPAFTDDFLAAVGDATSIKDLSRELQHILADHLQENENKSRDFLLRSVNMPVFNHALLSYFLGATFATPTHSKTLNP